MKVVIKIQDIFSLAQRFEQSPMEAMREVVGYAHGFVQSTLERAMESEIELFLRQPAEAENKKNGFTSRTFSIKGVGALRLRVPRDRAGRFSSKIIPPHKRYDPGLEKDLALLHLAGLSTRTLSYLSRRVLGVQVSAQEVSGSIQTILPAAKAFLERPLAGRKFKYLYIDGTNFLVRRSTVEREPTLVVIGVDEDDRKSVLSMVQGDKDSRGAWEMVFARLKERGLEGSAVQLGIMDGLPGLGTAFLEAFPKAKVARCWVHKARNVFPLVPVRYQAEFKINWHAIGYAENENVARTKFESLKSRWGKMCGDAVSSLERDLEALLIHYTFPKEHWDALRTTNPIERVNKEFKRRSKAMETVGPDGLKALLAFTALRLEFGWSLTPISSNRLPHLYRARKDAQLESISRALLQ